MFNSTCQPCSPRRVLLSPFCFPQGFRLWIAKRDLCGGLSKVAKLGFGNAVGRGGVRGGWGIRMRVFLKRRVRNVRGVFFWLYLLCDIYRFG